MSKKELVKNVIDELINQGKDFHEITQGTLSQIKDLESISKTTIKRAKNEYKKEKIVVKSNYKETLIKRKIYKYLDRYPRTSLSELREALPEISPSKVNEYHLFWTRKREKKKAENKTQKQVTVNPRKLKELVFSYLNSNEDISCDQLIKAFPDANKSSVTSYYGHWKKKRASHEKGKEGSLYQVIFRYLDNHPESSINDLKKSFNDVPQRSLEVYFNLWLKKQKELYEALRDKESINVEEEDEAIYRAEAAKIAHESKIAQTSATTGKSKGKKKKLSETKQNSATVVGTQKKSEKENKKTKRVADANLENIAVPEPANQTEGNSSKLVNELVKKIEDQKLTLTALEVEHSMLKDKYQSKLVEGFDLMTEDELFDIREFVKTYVKGLKEKKQNKV